MTSLATRFDGWVQRGPFTQLDLGIYRIVFSITMLFSVPDITWMSNFPDSFLHTPAGPFRVLSAIPPHPVLVGLEVARSAALVLLGLGLATRITSWLVALILVVTYGIDYSLGHVHHTFYLVATPLVLSFADWGSRLSIDSLRRTSQPPTQPQWPIRLLALIVGLGFASAALPKLLGGWLSPTTHATEGYFFSYFFTSNTSFWLGDAASKLHNALAWESLDWFTVLLEFGVLAALPWWRAFRISLAVATLFHIGVFLLLGIPFASNIITYGAFVSWGACMARRTAGDDVGAPTNRSTIRLLTLAMVTSGVLATALLVAGINTPGWTEPVIVFIGAGVGIWYLVHCALTGLRRYRVSVTSR